MQEILVNVDKQRNKTIVVVENGRLVEKYQENDGAERLEGNIYIGKVQNVLLGMQAAFVDIGKEKNTFIHIRDVMPKASNETGNKNEPLNKYNIKDYIRTEMPILVQVKKDSTSEKGARVSTHMNISGRYIVLMPNSEFITVSKKIEDIKEKNRLLNIVKPIVPKGYGIIIRTSAEGKNETEIKEDLDKLIKKCNENVDNDYILKCNNGVYLLKIFYDKEVSLIDITELYKLQEQAKLQNKKIKANNEKILDAINNIEKIEKTKNLLKIKNEYHDIIGHRLALLTKYLEQERKDAKSILFLLDSIYEDFDFKLSSDEKLKNLVKIYQVIGINIIVKGKLPIDEKIANIFFEIIREAVTNAIIHADSKNIKVIITQYLDRIEMIITNDGKKPSSIIYENDGIKGMRRKLTLINGRLCFIYEAFLRLKTFLFISIE